MRSFSAYRTAGGKAADGMEGGMAVGAADCRGGRAAGGECAGANATGMGFGGGVLGIGAAPPDLGAAPPDLGEPTGALAPDRGELKTLRPFGGEPAGGEEPTPHVAQVMAGAGAVEVRRVAAPFEAPISGGCRLRIAASRRRLRS